MDHFDVVILGEGLAGTTAALRLATDAQDRRVAVVEPRTDLPNDRTWCFWNTAATGWEDQAAHRWSAWTVQHQGTVTRAESTRYQYHCLPAERFFAKSRETLDAAANVQCFRGVRAMRVSPDSGSSLSVETTDGTLTTDWVLDSRPLSAADQSAWVDGELLQHFVGWHIETDLDAFDPETVTLMDFDVPCGNDEIHFEYVLPFSRNDALIEATYFSCRTLPDAAYETAIRDYLETRFLLTEGDYRIVRKERGVIPMSRRQPQQSQHHRWIRIGTPGGLAKPSTGYAFSAVQAWTKRLVAAIESGRTTVPAPRTRTQVWMDRVFLSVLLSEPTRAPELFARMFAKVSPDAVARFLTDNGTLRDAFDVVRSMPKLPFLRQLRGLTAAKPAAHWSPSTTSEVIS